MGCVEMALEFGESLRIPPIPTDARRAALQARLFADRVRDLGGVDAAIERAVQAIYDADPADAPSEQKRLRLLYQKTYTRDELRALVETSFANLGLRAG